MKYFSFAATKRPEKFLSDSIGLLCMNYFAQKHLWNRSALSDFCVSSPVAVFLNSLKVGNEGDVLPC
jgi:hypothetical protein